MAGRLTPGSLRRRSIDSAISAPVLPQDTAAVASPGAPVSIVDHIEVPSPLRSTWLGLSPMLTTFGSIADVAAPGTRPPRRAINCPS